MVNNKVDNPENQSWVNVKFEKFAFHEVWLYGICMANSNNTECIQYCNCTD